MSANLVIEPSRQEICEECGRLYAPKVWPLLELERAACEECMEKFLAMAEVAARAMGGPEKFFEAMGVQTTKIDGELRVSESDLVRAFAGDGDENKVRKIAERVTEQDRK